MTALSEELLRLVNPAPVFQDPEDNEDETSAKVVGKSGKTSASQLDEDNFLDQISSLRRKAAISQQDSDKKYAGKRTSRKHLSPVWDTPDDLAKDYEEEDDTDEDNENEDDDVDDDDDDEDKNIRAFHTRINKTSEVPGSAMFSFEDDGDFSKYTDMDYDDDDNDEDDEEEDDDEGSDEITDDEMDDNNKFLVGGKIADDGGVASFSKVNVEEEVQKGQAVKHQLSLWDSLLENRIQLQKVAGLVNQLPQKNNFKSFQEQGGSDFKEQAEKAQSSLCDLLNKLILLQTHLLLQNADTRHIITGSKEEQPHSLTSNKAVADEDDEEITSESDMDDDENNADEKKSKENVKDDEDTDMEEGGEKKNSGKGEDVKEMIAKCGIKRKLTVEQHPQLLAKRHRDFLGFRNNTIQKWYDKTRLVGGRTSSKSFSSFDQSAVKQIQQILSDKHRLIKRTQLKRSRYKILGNNEETQVGQKDTTPETLSVGDDSLKIHDPEIFDDNDFYQQQLRELIERKTLDTSDPIALSRQWLEINRLRKKIKKKVDTRASKGRKVRYDVHKKLVNFMAPEDNSTWTDEARNDLFKSLFGKKYQDSGEGDLSMER